MQISSLDTIKGRKILKNIYFDLKFNKMINSLSVLLILWRICTNKDQIEKYSNIDVEITHNLGFARGTALWMQEIFNRYYFSMLNAFVYLGAAILLLIVGIRRFSDLINDTIVIFGFVLEALLLVLMFIFLLFSPKDDIIEEVEKEDKEDETENLISEIGEIARDFADASLKLNYINQNLTEISSNQKQLLNSIEKISENIIQTVQPNTTMLEIMDKTNKQLEQFNQALNILNNDLNEIRKENIEFLVKKQLENLIFSNIKNDTSNK